MNLYGEGLLDPNGVFLDVSVARFREGSRRKWGPEIDQLRRPARRFHWREIWKDLSGTSAMTARDLARDLVACPLQATPCRPPLG